MIFIGENRIAEASRIFFVLGFLALLPVTMFAQQTLRIAAAADLQPVLPSLIADYAAQSKQHVEASYQSSATLSAQIENGAPFDLFLSADMSFPQKLIADRLCDSDKPFPYAQGTLVLWTRNDSHFAHPSLATLRNPALKRLAIANPQHAPYGRAAMASLTRLGLADMLKSPPGYGRKHLAGSPVCRLRKCGCRAAFPHLGPHGPAARIRQLF